MMYTLVLLMLWCSCNATKFNNYYGGRYTGRCTANGYYYMDEENYATCEGGVFASHPCAPGTRNRPYSQYPRPGMYKDIVVCDVNMVDDGFSVKKYQQAQQDLLHKQQYQVPQQVQQQVQPQTYYAPAPAPVAPLPVQPNFSFSSGYQANTYAPAPVAPPQKNSYAQANDKSKSVFYNFYLVQNKEYK